MEIVPLLFLIFTLFIKKLRASFSGKIEDIIFLLLLL